MYAKTSRLGFRFFAHAPGAPTCALALETLAHHMLKLELSNAARDAGSHAEIEVRSPDGTWRADVMPSDHSRAWRMALEAQREVDIVLAGEPGQPGPQMLPVSRHHPGPASAPRCWCPGTRT